MTDQREPKYTYSITADSKELRFIFFSSEEDFEAIAEELKEFGIVSRAEDYRDYTPPVWKLDVFPSLDFDEVWKSI